VYMLRAIRALLHGPLPEKWTQLADAPNLWRKSPFVLLLAALLVFGFFPSLLTDKIQPSAARVLESLGSQTAPVRASVPIAAHNRILNRQHTEGAILE
jgi:NADH:ubiquinone oxidoreductase subunit 4 (subunit M)